MNNHIRPLAVIAALVALATRLVAWTLRRVTVLPAAATFAGARLFAVVVVLRALRADFRAGLRAVFSAFAAALTIAVVGAVTASTALSMFASVVVLMSAI